ncbi:unnamed protein product [Tilletia controversa]|nr:hypothetical protein CF335_g8310 [Tilletia laevis]KAE8262526.1 hypothetical protein A4X03_0g2384 [Tilletia caries]CAD6906022.1 unnamed protein product [Tilletia controversa]KAE8197762.1 hypothetical protein CF336_g1997 [Tilletia laevis]CAD6888612.1 unnamed protein product [Tilletia caries]
MNLNSFNASLAGLDLGAFASPAQSTSSPLPSAAQQGSSNAAGRATPAGAAQMGMPGLGAGGPSPYAQHYSQYPFQQQQQQQQQQQHQQQHHYGGPHLGAGSVPGSLQPHSQQQQQHLLSLGGGPSALAHSLNNPGGGNGGPSAASASNNSTANGGGGGGGGNGAPSTALTSSAASGPAPSTSNPNTALSVYYLITQLCQRPDQAGPGGNQQGSSGQMAGTPASTHASAGPGQGQGANGTGAAPSPTASHANAASSSDPQNNNKQSIGSTTNALTGLPYGDPGSSPLREHALLELSKKREQYDDLALVLWHSFGVMSSLLQEIIAVYPMLSPPTLTAHASNRVCNALALLQCVASHAETRSLFLQAHIPLFLYPFLNTTSKNKPFEYLRLTSLGVIGALVKQNDNSDVITFLLSTEIIPLCLRIMETGSELSKTVAIFIVQKILLDDMGLSYVCQTYERFYAVGTVLANMVAQIVETQAVRLLKHVVRCYLRLSDNPRAREALRACLPGPLRDATFSILLKNDHITKRCLATLMLNLSDRVE